MRTISLLLLAVLAACSVNIVHVPPAPRTASSRTFDVPFEKAWAGVVSWFASSNITVDKIEKTSGLITAQRSVMIGEDMVEIGSLSSSWCSHGLAVQVCRLNLNVFVLDVDGGKSTVNINTFGWFRAVAYKGWITELEPSYYEGSCNSNGKIEAMLFAHVERLAAATQN